MRHCTSQPCRTCYEQCTQCPPTVPSRSLKPFPHTHGFDRIPCGRVKEGRSFPKRPAFPFGFLFEGANIQRQEQCEFGATNLIYVAPDSRYGSLAMLGRGPEHRAIWD
jgi:hypothetical protein